MTYCKWHTALRTNSPARGVRALATPPRAARTQPAKRFKEEEMQRCRIVGAGVLDRGCSDPNFHSEAPCSLSSTPGSPAKATKRSPLAPPPLLQKAKPPSGQSLKSFDRGTCQGKHVSRRRDCREMPETPEIVAGCGRPVLRLAWLLQALSITFQRSGSALNTQKLDRCGGRRLNGLGALLRSGPARG